VLDQVRLPVPVVVIGNITAGGTGKTPLSIWLAAALARSGRRPGIVCRSYAARADIPAPVPSSGDPAHYGDEAVLMATRAGCPVWSGPQRARTAQAMMSACPEIDVVVCDDGLQHYALHRDVEIAVIDTSRAFGNGCLLPAGPLREPIARLHSVDAIVLHGAAAVAELPVTIPHYRMHLDGERFVHVGEPQSNRAAREFADQRLVAVAGIGNPERFFEHLRKLGIEFTAKAFPDHHRYEPADIAALDADCVLMTEKDAIKCARFPDARMWMLPVDAHVDTALLIHVLSRIEARNGHQRPPAT